MKKAHLLILIFCLILKSNSFPQSDSISSYPISTELSIENIVGNEFDLVLTVTPTNGYWVVSPFSNDSINQKLELIISKKSDWELINPLNESPKSKESIDPILNLSVRYVKSKTVYRQRIRLNKKELKVEINYMALKETMGLQPKSEKFEILSDESIIVITPID